MTGKIFEPWLTHQQSYPGLFTAMDPNDVSIMAAEKNVLLLAGIWGQFKDLVSFFYFKLVNLTFVFTSDHVSLFLFLSSGITANR